MNNAILYGGIGLIAGALLLPGGAGWLVGALLGVMLGQIQALSRRLSSLEEQVRLRQFVEDQAFEQVQRDSAGPPVQASPLRSEPSSPPPSSTPRIEANVTRASESASWDAANTRAEIVLPDILNKALVLVRRFCTEGNPIVRVGVVVMFFGLSFLVKYASSAGLLPVELRLTVVAGVATALMVLGWKTRNREGGYGLVLQGGGIAALYLTVFAANKFYSLMPAAFALGLMFAVVVFAALLAILQNAQVLALIASAGGFLAPILTSDGSGNHLALFSFYLLLNLGVLAISWFKAWRWLNWTGFVFTFVISSAWGLLSYQPSLYVSTQPFLAAFFLLYLTVSVLFSLRQPPKLTGLVDGSLVFGLPIVAFGLQTAVLKHTEYGVAISAVVLATIYVGLAGLLWTRYRQTHRLLCESFIALGVVFATLAVPLAMNADWTSATWAIEAAGLVWVGLKQQRLLPRLAGYLLYLAGAGSLLIDGGLHSGSIPVISGDFVGLVILAAAAFAIAFVLQRNPNSFFASEEKVEIMSLAAGFGWWFLAGINELTAHLSSLHHFAAALVFFSATALVAVLLASRLRWPKLVCGAYSLLPLVALWVGGTLLWSQIAADSLHPFRSLGLLGVGSFAAVQFFFLWRQRTSESKVLINGWHVLSVWLLLAIFYWEAWWWQGHLQLSETRVLLLWFGCFALPLIALMATKGRWQWPFQQYRRAYWDAIPSPLVFCMLFWFVAACFSAGNTAQLHLPLLNPLDLAQLAAILVLAYVFRHGLAGLAHTESELRYGLLGLAGFAWLNVVVLRAVHHYTGVEYREAALWDSSAVQMALSILWSLCALLLMNLSRRMQIRKLWLVGAGLLALVLLKLFTKDLTDTGTLARIISFLVVGGLMLLIGYLSPIPATPAPAPEAKEEAV